MAVTPDDVRHVAALARLGIPDERIPALVGELNGILTHMDVLAKVKTNAAARAEGVGAAGMPLRTDDGPQLPLGRPRESFAPQMRDGFLLVPRLSTHEDAGEAE